MSFHTMGTTLLSRVIPASEQIAPGRCGNTLWEQSVPSEAGLTLAGNHGNFQSLLATFIPPLQASVYDSIFETSSQYRPPAPQQWDLIYEQHCGTHKCWGASVSGGITILAPGLLSHQEEQPKDRG